MGRALCLLWLATACYSTNPVEGLPCSPMMRCPEGQRCDEDTLTCTSEPIVNLPLDGVSAGATHTCGVGVDSSLWCWGDNRRGELGAGDADAHDGGVLVSEERIWVTVSSGDEGTCALKNDSSLWCWGDRRTTGVQANRPAQVLPGQGFFRLSVGYAGFCAVDNTGATWCRWYDEVAPHLEDSTVVATEVAASDRHQCVLDGQKQLYCWGNNDRGQVGNGNNGDIVATPYQIPGTWVGVVTSREHTCALDTTDHIWCWGACTSYQALDYVPPDSGYCSTPTRLDTISGSLVLSANGDDTCTITEGHNITCFGDNTSGQLGAPTREPHSLPVQVTPSNDFLRLAVGGDHACAIASDGTTWCWGDNRYDQLGNGQRAFAQTPQLVDSNTWLAVSAGVATTCAIAADRGLWCWGNDAAGQAGAETGNRVTTPRRVGSETDWIAVAAGTNHSCGLRGSAPGAATLWCWGANEKGQLGAGSSAVDMYATPRQVGMETDWFELVAGTMESCGTRTGGELWCWGDANAAGAPAQVGTDTGWQRLTAEPTEGRGAVGIDAIRGGDAYHFDNGVSVLSHGLSSPSFTLLASGRNHHCGIDASSALLCWGDNTYGQTGVDGTTFVTVATREPLSKSWRFVDAGGDDTCAIANDDKMYCWGHGDVLGTPSADESNAMPKEVVHTGGWATVSVGDHYACAITKVEGQLYCWGANKHGELGAGPSGMNHPVRLRPESSL